MNLEEFNKTAFLSNTSGRLFPELADKYLLQIYFSKALFTGTGNVHY